MNLIVHTEKSIDKPEIYISTENENADLLLKKTPNLIKNINNNKNFIASSSQPKINRLTNKFTFYIIFYIIFKLIIN